MCVCVYDTNVCVPECVCVYMLLYNVMECGDIHIYNFFWFPDYIIGIKFS